MRTFLASLCLIAITSARPDVGYNYPQPVSAPAVSALYSAPPRPAALYDAPHRPTALYSSPLVPPSVSYTSSGSPAYYSSSSNPSYWAPSSSFSSSSSNYGGYSSSSSPNYGYSSSSYSSGPGAGYSSYSSYNQEDEPIITKQFYLHAAPEEQLDVVHKHFKIGRAQKNYRVVFIKAPSESGAAAHLSAEYPPNEEKTVIYVLSKKPGELEISDLPTPAPTEPTKPDVFFLKYKTDQEALHAQHEIQAKYDALGGSSQVSDEGVSQVTSVIGSAGGSSHSHPSYHHHHHTSQDNVYHGSSGISHGGSTIGGVATTGHYISSGGSSSKYLPPNH